MRRSQIPPEWRCGIASGGGRGLGKGLKLVCPGSMNWGWDRAGVSLCRS